MQNFYSAIEKDVIDERDFASFEIKMCFGGMYYNATVSQMIA